MPPEARADLPMLEPVYPLTAGLSGKVLLKACAAGAGAHATPCPSGRSRPGSSSAAGPRFARSFAAVASSRGGRRRLAGFRALAAARLRRAVGRPAGAGPGAAEPKNQPGRSVEGDGSIRARIAAALPFALTKAQRQALQEIAEDMPAPLRMLRLLQGDVGSGKTVVALLAMADRRGGRRAGCPDGAHRGAGAPARRDHRSPWPTPPACASAC